MKPTRGLQHLDFAGRFTGHKRLRALILLTAAIWTALCVSLAYWENRNDRSMALAIALEGAGNHFALEAARDFWIEVHQKSIASTDLAFPSKLLDSNLLRATSLQGPTLPDAWEREALLALESGEPEVFGQVSVEGKNCLRVMRPLVLSHDCMECHNEGSSVGAMRGGIVLTLPWQQGVNTVNLETMRADLVYAGIWFVGILGLGLVWRKSSAWLTDSSAADARVRQLSRAVEQSPVSIVITDRTGNIEYVNPKFNEVTGYTFEEAIGQNPRILKSGNKPPEEYAALWKTITDGLEWRGEFLNKKKNGEEYWESASISPIRDENGDITHFVAVKEDISARKRMERERSWLISVLENSNDIVVVKDLDLRVVSANRAFLSVAGRTTVEEIIGKTDAEIFGVPENTEPIRTYMDDDRAAQRLNFGEFIVREEPVVGPDGTRRMLLTRKHPIYGEDRELIGTGNVSVDITDRIQVEESLRASEARFRAITESAQDAIIMMDPQGIISFWNAAAEKTLGYSAEEALGKHLHQLIAPERFHRAHAEAFDRFRTTGTGAAVGTTLDLEARRKDGHEICAQLSLSAIELNDGWHAVGILRDITQRKRAEEQLLEMNRQLETATAKANSMAAEAAMANAAKSEFLANMSHEIRTPMNGVIGMTGLLLDSDLNPEQRQFAEIVRTSAEALLSLINDILDFSKIEAKKLDLEVIDFDLVVTMEDTAELLAVASQKKNLDLVCSVDPEVPALLRGDPGRLRQILLNLGGNAVKFTGNGNVSIGATLLSENETQATVRFSVADTGIGIPRAKIDYLFNPFTQADGSTTRRYGGTGLGLAISKQLAELMGGTIGVDSCEGQGSTFWFTANFQKQSGTSRLELPSLPDLDGIRVLVVDDNAVNRTLVRKLVEPWQCQVAEAENGEAAVAMLLKAARENEPYDMALVDMQMPGMDGEELGRRIRSETSLDAIKLIVMTSLAHRGQARHLESAGFQGYLTKPIRQTQLRECMQLVLGLRERSLKPVAGGLITKYTVSEARRRRARILLAEDNHTNQLVALNILAKLGYRADAVGNGKEVLNALELAPYDLVIMDCQMPDMDGFEATKTIRAWAGGGRKTDATGIAGTSETAGLRHRHANIPIIAMTAYAMQGDRELCLAAGMNDYLSKPVRPSDLAAALDRWLGTLESGNKEDPPAAQFQDRSAGTSPRSEVEVNSELHERQRPDPSPSSVFDGSSLVRRLMGDHDLAKEIVAEFLHDIPQQIAKLDQFVQDGDRQSAERQAHSIHGASANVGAESLRQIAAKVEKLAATGSKEGIAALRTDLNQEFEELRQEMESWMRD